MFFPKDSGMRAMRRVIVLGAGEIGRNLALRLASENRQVVVVDHNPKKLQAALSVLDAQGILGSASSPEVLDEAGIARADTVVAVTGSDEVNLLACLVANVKNPGSLKLARVKNEEYVRMSDVLGPEHLNVKAVINPDVEVVDTVLRMIRLPTVVDYGEFGDGKIKIVAVEVKSGLLMDKPLTDFPGICKDPGVRVGGILRGERLILPKGCDVIRGNDVVYFACLAESLDAVLRVADARFNPIRNLCVVGGGDIGLRLARNLDRRDYRVKLVEKDERRCRDLAEQLAGVVVLHGDGTDRDFMKGENMGNMDMVIALTGDEETNILTCLLAKSIGSANTITRVNKNGYMPIVRAIGLKLSVNPRLAASNSIVRFLRRGLHLSTLTTHDEDVEMLEAVLTDSSRQLENPLKRLSFPPGTNLLAVLRRDSVFIPGGDTVLRSGDRVILICERERLAWVDENLIGR